MLNSALNAGHITEDEYDAALGGLDALNIARGNRSAINQANFKKAAGPLSLAGSVIGQFSNTQGSIDASAAQAREGMRGAIGQMGP